MRLLQRYLGSAFLVSFCSALLILTFVMSLGVIFQVMNLLSRGVMWGPLLWILACGVPASLSFSIPVSAMVSTLLMFGRLSADGEITAMKSCGVGMWQIMITPLLFAALLSGLCFYINSTVSPNGFYAQSRIRRQLATTAPLKLLTAGRVVREFVDGMSVYIGAVNDNELTDVRIWDSREEGVTREIAAQRGVVMTNAPGGGVVIELHDVTVDPLYADSPGPVFCKSWSVDIGLRKSSRGGSKRPPYMTLSELIEARKSLKRGEDIVTKDEAARKMMSLTLHIQRRLVLSVSVFVFVLLGVPLGVVAHRRESSVGIGISLLLVFVFYLVVSVAESLERMPQVRPDLMIWIPVVAVVALGWWLAERSN